MRITPKQVRVSSVAFMTFVSLVMSYRRMVLVLLVQRIQRHKQIYNVVQIDALIEKSNKKMEPVTIVHLTHEPS